MAASNRDINNNVLERENIVPITCEVFNGCLKIETRVDHFKYKHLVFQRLSLLAKVEEKRVTDGMLHLTLNDMTSMPHVKAAFPLGKGEGECSAALLEKIVPGRYLKVMGLIKYYEGEKLLRVICAKPMTELNEITHHMLSCINASLHQSQEIAQRRGPGVLLSALETLLLQIITANDSTDGETFNYIKINVTDHSIDDIKIALKSLFEHGLISSIDSGKSFVAIR